MTSRLPHLIGTAGPAVIVPGRVAAILDRQCRLTDLRVRTRGVDPEATAVLEALHVAALAWRSSSTGTEAAPEPEPATRSEWMGSGQAADLLGVTSRAVRKAIADGRLAAVEVGGRYRISREDVEHYRASRAA